MTLRTLLFLKGFFEASEIEFPQFDYGIVFGVVGKTANIHDTLSERTLINLGVFNASALLDSDAGDNYREYKNASNEIIPKPALMDLFPWLLDGSKESAESLEMIKRFSCFRIHQLEEPKKNLSKAFTSKWVLLKENNPSFSEDAYNACRS